MLFYEQVMINIPMDRNVKVNQACEDWAFIFLQSM
jgi:hypothetical protein